MKGRVPLSKEVARFGSDQDVSIGVRIEMTAMGQHAIVITADGKELWLTARQAVDLQHKLGKVIIDWLQTMVEFFMKTKDDA